MYIVDPEHRAAMGHPNETGPVERTSRPRLCEEPSTEQLDAAHQRTLDAMTPAQRRRQDELDLEQLARTFGTFGEHLGRIRQLRDEIATVSKKFGEHAGHLTLTCARHDLAHAEAHLKMRIALMERIAIEELATDKGIRRMNNDVRNHAGFGEPEFEEAERFEP